MLTLQEDWEFNVLGIYNYRKPGPFDALFRFVQDNHHRLDGDIVEAGVYRGSSLIAMGMMLKELGSTKKVYGFDSFSGFPPVYHPNDRFEAFEDLHRAGRISSRHWDAVRRNLEWRKALSGTAVTSANVSSSGDFSATGLDLVRTKISLVGLDNIVLIDGAFGDTMVPDAPEPKTVMAMLMDCDLYQSYIQAFEFVWPRMVGGAMIYLDEYYSLKFPGARMATDEFIDGKAARLVMAPQKPGDFERWFLLKE
jgi:hypothetical protein